MVDFVSAHKSTLVAMGKHAPYWRSVRYTDQAEILSSILTFFIVWSLTSPGSPSKSYCTFTWLWPLDRVKSLWVGKFLLVVNIAPLYLDEKLSVNCKD